MPPSSAISAFDSVCNFTPCAGRRRFETEYEVVAVPLSLTLNTTGNTGVALEAQSMSFTAADTSL